MDESALMLHEEPNSPTGVASWVELLLLDEFLHAFLQLLDLGLEQLRHNFEQFLNEPKFTNLLTGRLLLTR